jgi:DNA-binding NarL/FixJ family response regulator
MEANSSNAKSVLIVDDHRLVGEAFCEFLQATGHYATSVVNDVLEARAELLAFGPFDIVLLDLMMSGMEGPQTIAEIVRLNRGGRVVILTGGANHYRQSEVFASGAAGLILKSQPAQEILQALEHVLEGEMYFPRADDRILKRVTAA